MVQILKKVFLFVALLLCFMCTFKVHTLKQNQQLDSILKEEQKLHDTDDQHILGIFKDIASSVQKFNKRQNSLNLADDEAIDANHEEDIEPSGRNDTSKRTFIDKNGNICFLFIGCFGNGSKALKHLQPFKPFSPKRIGTAFRAYFEADASVEHIIDFRSVTKIGPLIDVKKRIVFLIHGFGQTYGLKEILSIKNSLLTYAKSEIGAVILVDWSNGSLRPHYDQAAVNAMVVGRQIAHFTADIYKHLDFDPSRFYLIGHQLGAHVAGFAGKYCQEQYGFRYGRITGLDASSPLFEGFKGAHLSADDAVYVDAIHTSVGTDILNGDIGFSSSYASCDFYPNNGRNQPFCNNKLGCNTHASLLLFDASITARTSCIFNSYVCSDYDNFLQSKCLESDTELGYYADQHPNAFGSRYLTTIDNYPYCSRTIFSNNIAPFKAKM